MMTSGSLRHMVGTGRVSWIDDDVRFFEGVCGV
jgi:hypothetical protein